MSNNCPIWSAVFDQLRRWDDLWRVPLAGDDDIAVIRLWRAGYLERVKRRVSLYRHSEKGWEAVAAQR